MKVAIVHEWLVDFRGSERVLLELARFFPEATIYASVLDRTALPPELAQREIITTSIQRYPMARSLYKLYLPFMPMAFESLNLSPYDLIISSSHSCAKGIIPPPGAVHVCYCYTPMRYAWSGYHEYRSLLRTPILRGVMSRMMHRLRQWDVTTVARVDQFIACSKEIQHRIQRYYHRNSKVVYPPVSAPTYERKEIRSHVVDLVDELGSGEYYLSLGRLVGYKRVDIAVDACTQLGVPLLVAGNGPEFNTLTSRAGDTVHFLKSFNDAEAAFLYENCRAFIFPGHEDFGITVVEAQARGKPVLAYGSGGALETIVEGYTGLFFSEQSKESLIDVLKQFGKTKFDERALKQNAARFSPSAFREAISSIISQSIEEISNYE